MQDQHMWAVYAPNGDVLTTLEKPHEGAYWMYKTKLAGEVGPYPDRDRPMLQHVDVCTSCEGAGTDGWSTNVVPHDEDGNPLYDQLGGLEIDPTRDADGIEKCGGCDGCGYRKKNGYGGYKTPQALKAAKTRGTAITCTSCEGRGTWYRVPIKRNCSSCGGVGRTLKWDATRPVLPPNVDRCDSATPEFMWDWVRDITITVVRDTVGMSWGEAHLGFAGLGSHVDYGRAWEQSDDEVIQRVLEDFLLTSTQYTKLIDPTTQVFGTAVVIRVTQQGLTPLVVGAPLVRTAGLPPTYFPTVFEEV